MKPGDSPNREDYEVREDDGPFPGVIYDLRFDPPARCGFVTASGGWMPLLP